jgi:hypothetical protein
MDAREVVARFLVSLGEGMSDNERAGLYRDLLMDYCLFSGAKLNKDRQHILVKIAEDYGRDAPALGKDTAKDLLSHLDTKINKPRRHRYLE